MRAARVTEADDVQLFAIVFAADFQPRQVTHLGEVADLVGEPFMTFEDKSVGTD